MATGQRTERLADGQIYRTFERLTGETVYVRAPFFWKDDFVAGAVAAAPDIFWLEGGTTGTGAASTPVANISNCHGVHKLTLTASANDAVAAIAGALATVDTGATTTYNNVQFECRLKVDLTAGDMAGIQIFCGMLDAIPTLTGDSTYIAATVGAGFIFGEPTTGEALGAELNIATWSDDTTKQHIGTGASTFVDDTWLILRLDMSATACKFYKDNVEIGAGGDSDMDNATAAEAVMFPYVGVLQHTSEGDSTALDIYIDYVQVWGTR